MKATPPSTTTAETRFSWETASTKSAKPLHHPSKNRCIARVKRVCCGPPLHVIVGCITFLLAAGMLSFAVVEHRDSVLTAMNAEFHHMTASLAQHVQQTAQSLTDHAEVTKDAFRLAPLSDRSPQAERRLVQRLASETVVSNAMIMDLFPTDKWVSTVRRSLNLSADVVEPFPRGGFALNRTLLNGTVVNVSASLLTTIVSGDPSLSLLNMARIVDEDLFALYGGVQTDQAVLLTRPYFWEGVANFVLNVVFPAAAAPDNVTYCEVEAPQDVRRSIVCNPEPHAWAVMTATPETFVEGLKQRFFVDDTHETNYQYLRWWMTHVESDALVASSMQGSLPSSGNVDYTINREHRRPYIAGMDHPDGELSCHDIAAPNLKWRFCARPLLTYPISYGYGQWLGPGVPIALLISAVVTWLTRQTVKKMNRKVAEMEEREATALAQRQAIEAVIGYINHEIRNPLNVILGSLDMVQDALRHGEGGKHQDWSLRTPHRGLESMVPGGQGHKALGFNDDNTSITAPSESSATAGQCFTSGGPSTTIHDAEPFQGQQGPRGPSPTACEAIQSDLNAIMRSAQTLRRQVDDLLEFQKLTKGKLSHFPKNCEIRGIIQEVLEEHEHLSEVPLSAVVDPLVPQILYIDELRVRQLVVNGLSNAIKHTKQGSIEVHVNFFETDHQHYPSEHGGGVEVVIGDPNPSLLSALRYDALWVPFPLKQRMEALASQPAPQHRRPCSFPCGRCRSARAFRRSTAAVHPRSMWELPGVVPPQRGFLQIAVKDTGEGLLGKDPEDLFKPFYSKKSTAGRTVLASTGLGLPICRMLARHLHGEVAIVDRSSTEPAITGCEFVVALPLTHSPPPRPQPELIVTASHSGTVSREALQEAAPSDSNADSSAAIPPSASQVSPALAVQQPSPPMQRRSPLKQHRLPQLPGTSPRLWTHVNGIPAGRVLVMDDSATNTRLACRMLQRLGSKPDDLHSPPPLSTFKQQLVLRLQNSGQLVRHDDGGHHGGGGGSYSVYDTGEHASESQPFACVLMDMSLGNEEGIAIFRSIRRHLRPPVPFFVAMTGAVASEDLQRYRREGLSGCLPKPFTLKTMEAMVKRVLPGKGFWPDDPEVRMHLYH